MTLTKHLWDSKDVNYTLFLLGRFPKMQPLPSVMTLTTLYFYTGQKPVLFFNKYYVVMHFMKSLGHISCAEVKILTFYLFSSSLLITFIQIDSFPFLCRP